MSDLEILDRAVSYTTGAYMTAYQEQVKSGIKSQRGLFNDAIAYSAGVLAQLIYDKESILASYTRRDNLRSDVASLDAIAIENQLLKTAVTVAAYQRLNDTRANRQIGIELNETQTDDDKAVIVRNNIERYGASRGYQLLDNPETLMSVCRTFASYRNADFKDTMDKIAASDAMTINLHNQLDTYYARWGESTYKSNK